MASPILKYEASAGSGKTYQLALEYLGRLLQAFAGPGKGRASTKDRQKLLGSILAITFTVKAAQEMKRRIVEKLKRFALSARGGELDAADKEFLDQLAAGTHLSKKKIVELSGDLIELILANYDDFNVKTIDSLMSAMVKVIAPDLDLPADYEIAVDARDELETRGRALLAGLADDDWQRLEETLADFKKLGSDKGWKTDEALAQKFIGLFHMDLRQGAASASRSKAEIKSRLDSHQDDFRKNMENLMRVLTAEPTDGYKNKYVNGKMVSAGLLASMTDFLKPGASLFQLEELLKKPFFYKSDARELLKKGALDAYGEALSTAYEQVRSCLQELTLDLSIFKTLPYREFYPDFIRAWNQSKETLFVEEFSQTLAGRFAAWGISGFPYLYLKMSDRFRNFLFDEFQDTSTLQFKALAPLIDEVLSQEKDASLFIVGDRKQAIYRWRGGNSGLMEENALRQEIPAINNVQSGGFSYTLGKNWRSRREIVGFNNGFWAPGAIARIAAEPFLQNAIQENFKASHQELPPGKETAGGYVELSLQVEEQRPGEEGEATGEEEAGSSMGGRQLGEVKKIIDRLRGQGYEYADIAVLVRKNSQVRDIVRRLGREGIPTISDQSLMLDSNPRVGEVIAFLRFLDYPPDNLNFHTFVSGGIFQKQAKDKFPREMAAFSEDIFIGRRGTMYKLFQDKFPDCWSGLIEPFFQAVGFLPPYDLFCDMTQVFRIFENFPGDTPFIMALGDTLHGAERDQGNSIAGFLRLWEKMVEDEATPAVTIPENTPGVRVLTMHQSKGLEFPAVIVPLNDSRGKNDDPLHWDPEGLFYINEGLALAHPGLKEKFQEETLKDSIDLLNLLYVSFTRAREALFIPVAARKIPARPVADKSGLAKRIVRASDVVGRHPLLAWCEEKAELLFTRGELEKKEGKRAGETPPADVPGKKVLTRSWQDAYLVFNKADIRERRDRSGAERGERMHDLLSRLGEISDPEQLDSRARQLAKAAGWTIEDTEVVTAYLCRDDVFRLLNRGQEFHGEKEITDNAGDFPKFLRLDRLQVSPEEVLVLDFKTGVEKSDDHVAQMREYMTAVAPLFPGRKCGGYLLYIDRGEIEEVPCSS